MVGRCRTGALAGVAVATALLIPGRASAQTAEHVFVFVIDGIRASEAADAPGLGVLGPLAHMADGGSILTRVDITGQTVTLPAHHTLLTGTWSDYGGTRPYEERTYHLPRSPTLFEAYRRHTGADQASTWLIGNTAYIHDLTHSFMPGYGETYAASRGVSYEPDTKDAWAWEQVDEALAQGEVDLMLVNLHEVDRRGHANEWDNYVGKGIEAAEGIADFWQRLQDDPVYAGSSVLIVTSDHGRHHDDIESGWISHGCYCRGCRNVFLLALGPGIRGSNVDDTAVSFLDIAPTIAQLMDFPMPYARGRVLTEILEGGELLSRGAGGDYRPQLARAGERLVRVHERHEPALDDAAGAHRVLAELSDDAGASWTEAPLVADDAWIQLAPMVRSHGDEALIGWLEQLAGGERVYSRLARLDPSEDTVDEVFEHEMTSTGTPASNLAVAGGGDDLVLAESNARNGITMFWLSDDGGRSWSETGPGPYVNGRYFPRDWTQMQAHDAWIAVFSAHITDWIEPEKPNDNTEVFVVRSESAGLEWGPALKLSMGPEPSIQPRLARTSDGILHAVWSDMESGSFQLTYAHSLDDGQDFSVPVQLTDAPLAAWEPALATDGERLLIAWSQFDGPDDASIHVAQLDGEVLVDELSLGTPGRVARTPSLVPMGDCTSVLTWSESDRVGPWELGIERVESSPIGATSIAATLDPPTVPAGGVKTLVRLGLELEIGPDDPGIDGLTVLLPAPFSLAYVGEVALDGYQIGATAHTEGPELTLLLDEPALLDGARIDLSLAVITPDQTDQEVVLEVEARHGRLGCPVPVSGELALATVPAGIAALPPAPDEGCRCHASGGASAGALALLLGLAVSTVSRRRR